MRHKYYLRNSDFFPDCLKSLFRLVWQDLKTNRFSTAGLWRWRISRWYIRKWVYCSYASASRGEGRMAAVAPVERAELGLICRWNVWSRADAHRLHNLTDTEPLTVSVPFVLSWSFGRKSLIKGHISKHRCQQKAIWQRLLFSTLIKMYRKRMMWQF